MAKEYFSEQPGVLKRHLFDVEAERDAIRLRNANVPPTQVRSYHSEVRTLEAKLASAKTLYGENAFDQIAPLLGLLKAKATYGLRNNSNQMAPLVEVLTECLDGVQDEATFKAMVQYMEAVVGYFIGSRE